MRRRSLLGALGAAAARSSTSSSRPPRKVIVGTVMQPFDQMQVESQRRYGRGIDLAMLPEVAVTGEAGQGSRLRAVSLQGEFGEFFAAKSREHRRYIVAPPISRKAGFRTPRFCSGGRATLAGFIARFTWWLHPAGGGSRTAAPP